MPAATNGSLTPTPLGPSGAIRNNPAPSPAANNVYRVKILGRLREQLTVTTFHYLGDKATNTPQAIVDFPAVFAAFTAAGGPLHNFEAAVSVDWTGEQIIVDSPNNPAAAPFVQLLDPTVDKGTGPTPCLPNQMAASLIKRTQHGGQCGRGRFALPAVPGVWQAEGRVTVPGQYNAFAAGCLNNLQVGAAGFVPVVYSANGSSAHPVSHGVTQLHTVTLNVILGTSRRRKPGVGA